MACHKGVQFPEGRSVTISEDPLRLPQEGPESLHLENLDHSVLEVSEGMQSKWLMCLKPILIV